MRIAHVLRRYQPTEWGESESALLELFDGLHGHGVDTTVFCPEGRKLNGSDPFTRAGHSVYSFQACLPIWGLEEQKRQERIGIGDKLMSFDLVRALRSAPALDAVHVHATGLIGALCLRAARARQIPCIISLPDEAADLPETEGPVFGRRPLWSFEWGKLCEFFLRSNRLLDAGDAIIASCPSESGFLAGKYPDKRILFHPHGVSIDRYEDNYKDKAAKAFPEIIGRTVLLCLARIEPARNQQWLLYQLPAILSAYPDALLVFVGSCTNAGYLQTIERCIDAMDLRGAVLMTGALPGGDPRLIGLMQHARALVQPSIVEPSGFTIMQGWAAGVPVIASRTASAGALIHHELDGWLFDLSNPHTLQDGLRHILSSSQVASRIVTAGRRRVQSDFQSHQLSGKIKTLYEELIDAKFAVYEQPRRRYGYGHPARV